MEYLAGASDRRPLHRAAGANNFEIVRYLLAHGADINAVRRFHDQF